MVDFHGKIQVKSVMDAINQFLVWIWAFTGLWVGFGLANIAKEELDPGRTYFIFFERIFFGAGVVPVILLTYTTKSWLLLGLVVAAFLVLNFARFTYDEFARYGFLFAVLFLTINNALFFVLTAAAMFLYGFPAGTLAYMKKYFV